MGNLCTQCQFINRERKMLWIECTKLFMSMELWARAYRETSALYFPSLQVLYFPSGQILRLFWLKTNFEIPFIFKSYMAAYFNIPLQTIRNIMCMWACYHTHWHCSAYLGWSCLNQAEDSIKQAGQWDNIL